MELKTIKDYQPYGFQHDTIVKALNTIRLNGGVCIFDETGLGKTIVGATIVANLDGQKILIISPKNNQKNWYKILPSATICTSAKITEGCYDTVVVDEAHRFGNSKNKSYKALSDIIYFGQKFPNVILLTATPVNNNIIELFNMIKLIPFKTDSIGMNLLPNVFDLAIHSESEVKKFERSGKLNLPHISNRLEYLKLKDKLANATEILGGSIKLISHRTTRQDIADKYQNDMELMGHFPKVVHNKIDFEYNDDKICRTLAILDVMPFAYHNMVNYTPDKDYTGLGSIMRTLLMKLLDSSASAFLSTLRNFKQSFEQARAGENVYENVNDSFWVDLNKDIDFVNSLFDIWQGDGLDGQKLDSLLDTINKIEGKVVIFTEYNATQQIIFDYLSTHFPTFAFNGQSSESDLDIVSSEFDPNVDKNTDKYKILVATDALSEGVNLHRATTLIHYDCKWNPSRMIQREGRINRLFKNGVTPPQIKVYTLAVENLIENIIKLENRIDNKSNFANQILTSNWQPKIVANGLIDFNRQYYCSNDMHLTIVKTNTGTVIMSNRIDNFVNSRLKPENKSGLDANTNIELESGQNGKPYTYFIKVGRSFGYENRVSNIADFFGIEDKTFANLLYKNPLYGALFTIENKDKIKKLIENANEHHVEDRLPVYCYAANYIRNPEDYTDGNGEKIIL
jgi:ERCC4-related helicase